MNKMLFFYSVHTFRTEKVLKTENPARGFINRCYPAYVTSKYVKTAFIENL